MNYKKDFRYANAEFNGDFSEKLMKAREWLRDWRNKHNNLFICGNTGCGKTYLAMAFLNELAKTSHKYESYRNNPEWWDIEGVEYVVSKKLFDTIKLKFASDQTQKSWAINQIKAYARASLLMIDEFGLGYGTDSELIELTDLLDERWRKGLPTVFLSNLSISVIGNYLKERAAQRAFDGAEYIEIKDKTHRIKPKELS